MFRNGQSARTHSLGSSTTSTCCDTTRAIIVGSSRPVLATILQLDALAVRDIMHLATARCFADGYLSTGAVSPYHPHNARMVHMRI